MSMSFIKASLEDLPIIQRIVQQTINAIYTYYYKESIVKFFLEHHCPENILNDLKLERVFILYDNDIPVGTGSIADNHITRLFVLPEFQKKGYGSYIMDRLERMVSEQYTKAVLDSSFPAFDLYLKRNYQPMEYKNLVLENGDVLCYYTMEKQL